MTAESPAARGSRLVLAALFLAYPLWVYSALTRLGPRQAALALLGVVLTTLLVRRRQLASDLRSLGVIPWLTASLLGLSAAIDTSWLLLAIPAVANFVLLVGFGATLRAGPPMIERFARLIDPDLSPAEVSWCRLWTRIWCVFFAVNGAAAALLALWGSLFWWAFYTGLIAYLMIGTLIAIEWCLRKMRFKRFGRSWPERLARRLLQGRVRSDRLET